MSEQMRQIENFISKKYSAGFITDIEADSIPPGLDEGVIREISQIKDEPKFMLKWRLQA